MASRSVMAHKRQEVVARCRVQVGCEICVNPGPCDWHIHAAQRWFNGAWLTLQQKNGYSRALPLRWMPAFTEKSEPQEHAPMKEWEAAVEFLTLAARAICGSMGATNKIF
ncbi:MAG: hypothetical protein Q9P01_16985 [Anaerolineae bacterium]|nr:hypothetical protein [Anaerolineae bacterium]